MSALYLDALKVKVADGVLLLLADDTLKAPARNLSPLRGLPEGWLGTRSSKEPQSPRPQDRPAIIYDAQLAGTGMHPLQIHELRTFYWNLEVTLEGLHPDDFRVTSSLEGSARARDWRPKQQKGSLHGTFSFMNYLGAAWMEVGRHGSANTPYRVLFDVVTAKLDYASEYKAMVEAIGNECHQLLLEWGSPTAVNISQDSYQHSQTLLEQFLFLQHVLGPNRLELYLEVLHRQPHSQLVRERVWQPAGSGPASLFLTNPLRFGRDWQKAPSGNPGTTGGWIAAEILSERKFDSGDTPPNRFVKFALESFRALCEDVINCEFTEPGPPSRKRALREEEGAAWQEAVQMRDTLDAFLCSPFFRDVGPLARIPFESQTLQKREGYRDILQAFLMLDAAAQIDWPGRNDAYDGSNRDVATLYEFWLYFVLVRAFKSKTGLAMTPQLDPLNREIDGARPFCCTGDDGRMMIHLKRDKASFCRFTWTTPEGSLRIHFFYNRPFNRSRVNVRGTYSKGFRPDYTLVIIPGDITEPDWEKAERVAEIEGRIAYLHFDAKYRVDKLTAVLGEEEEAPEDRQAAKATGTYKNADLYKMHTYNEAIRRTVGAYVLYPGDDPRNEVKKNRFEKYHEIVPGVGAFALRPSPAGPETEPAGLDDLLDFLKQLLTHQLSRFTQSYRINYWTHETIRDTPVNSFVQDAVNGQLSLPGANVLLGFIPTVNECRFRTGNYFYCRAIPPDGTPLDLDISAAQGSFFAAWNGQWAGRLRTYNWVARIKACHFLTSAAMTARYGITPGSPSTHYLHFELADISPLTPRDITSLVHTRNGRSPRTMYRALEVSFRDLLEQPLGL